MSSKIVKSDEEWRAQLSEEQFQVTRKHTTERAFTGKYHDNHQTGAYACICCGAELFHSDTKFDSGTGWPSFTSPSLEENVGQKSDRSFFMVRTEVHCAQCEAHLGHVFNDGPVDAGGLRYCINSASLDFQKDD
jgi:peptide-methionine (R)-S-oxide reductase